MENKKITFEELFRCLGFKQCINCKQKIEIKNYTIPLCKECRIKYLKKTI